MATITIITREAPPITVGGVGNTARLLVDKLKKTDYNVNLITLKFGKFSYLKSFEIDKNIKIYRINMNERLLFWYKTALFSYSNKEIFEKSDLIHLLNVRDAPFIRKYNKPVISNINDYYSAFVPINPLKFPFKEKGKARKYINYMHEKFLDFVGLKRSDFIIYNSEFTRNKISKYFNLKNKKNIVIYKGVDVHNFNKQVKKDIDLLFVGAKFVTKGASEFIEAVEILKKEFPNISCLIAGKPSRIDLDYNKLIREKGLSDNIKILTNLLPHGELYELYLRARIYILPTYIEALGQTILEAMSAKLPVIVTYAGGIPEIITNNKDGFLIRPYNVEDIVTKVRLLLNDKKLMENIGEEAFKTVKKRFNSEKMTEEYLKIYEKFI